jgi:hypothetical protein
VPCANFTRLADADVAGVGEFYEESFSIYQRKGLFGCPPRELVLAVTGLCGITLSSPTGLCEVINHNEYKFYLEPQKGGAAAVARRIKDHLSMQFWSAPWGPERAVQASPPLKESFGNVTVAALEPNGPGGRGLLALKLDPIGCIYRYMVVEGELPGASAPVAAAAAPAAAGGTPLPAATRWCPGGTTKAPEPAKLEDPGERVPLCVTMKRYT